MQETVQRVRCECTALPLISVAYATTNNEEIDNRDEVRMKFDIKNCAGEKRRRRRSINCNYDKDSIYLRAFQLSVHSAASGLFEVGEFSSAVMSAATCREIQKRVTE
ncbi:hypothetical protein JOB18_048643 [Solea senegalensis]|uniref:Uncharacterized protein n=1 Tax=Solea senegalensis TaxID=28829 RepID=A0AAV6REK5_SOLSE|nr:hypothetical protein JOB18_048643 [Solea senegalensis]